MGVVACEPSSGPDEGGADTSQEGEEGEKGESSEDAAAPDLGEAKASEVIALDAPKDRVKRCKELGEKIYAKHGIEDGQDVVKCEEDGTDFEASVFEIEEICGVLNGDEPFNCAMTYDQLAWCFEGAPECSLAKQQICAMRLELMCDPSVAPKKKPSDKRLRQDALHLSKVSTADFEAECKRLLKADQKKFGVKPGDEYECEGSSTTVPVEDPDGVCEDLSEMLDMNSELCDLRMGDLLGCFSVDSSCDSDTEHMCQFLVAGCAEGGPA